MLTISIEDHQIYNPMNPNLQVLFPVLTMEDNTAGKLTFQIYEDNANIEYVKKLYPFVTVFRDGNPIFKGRVINDSKNFYNGKNVEIEGKLAVLNDTLLLPFDFNGSPEELFQMIIENHNSFVKDWQKFKVGKVTVNDPNDYVVRSSETALTSWQALKEKCFQSSLGGHIQIRYENDGDYIDWIEDYDKESSQSIEFAKNLLDLKVETDASETYTAIYPVGALIETENIEEQYHVTIESVNDGKGYLINEEMAEEYGVIFAPEKESTWSDVTIPENLLKKAKEKLYGSFPMLSESYEIKAIDMNLTDKDIEALNVCEYVHVRSIPHSIDSKYLLYRLEIHMDEPQNSVFNLGISKRTLYEYNSSKLSDQKTEIEKLPGQIEKVIEKNYAQISGAEFKGMLVAFDSEDDKAQVRNIVFSTTTPENVEKGQIVFVYSNENGLLKVNEIYIGKTNEEESNNDNG